MSLRVRREGIERGISRRDRFDPGGRREREHDPATPRFRIAPATIVPHTPIVGMRTNPARATPTTAPARFNV
jgi:hypothetical protein